MSYRQKFCFWGLRCSSTLSLFYCSSSTSSFKPIRVSMSERRQSSGPRFPLSRTGCSGPSPVEAHERIVLHDRFSIRAVWAVVSNIEFISTSCGSYWSPRCDTSNHRSHARALQDKSSTSHGNLTLSICFPFYCLTFLGPDFALICNSSSSL